MIPAYKKDLLITPGQPDEEFIQHFHRLGRRDTLVINVSGDEYGVRGFTIDHPKDFLQDVLLVFR
jgi:hypothetical protein